MVASPSRFSYGDPMRIDCALLFVASLCGCSSEEDTPPEPIGERFLIAAGGVESGLEMFRADQQIELRIDGERQAIGTLAPEGLAAWDHAVASVDPALVPGLYRCAAADGVDVCVDVEPESGPLQVCYCAIDPPAEVAQFNAFFTSLIGLLGHCESSSLLTIDSCEGA